jgi:hypothetical protein
MDGIEGPAGAALGDIAPGQRRGQDTALVEIGLFDSRWRGASPETVGMLRKPFRGIAPRPKAADQATILPASRAARA